MLSDNVIDGAQNILRVQFKVNRLQDTVIGEKLMLREEKEPFAQVLRNGYSCTLFLHIMANIFTFLASIEWLDS